MMGPMSARSIIQEVNIVVNIKIKHNISFLIYSIDDYNKSIEWVKNNTDWNPVSYGIKLKNWFIGFIVG